MTVSSLQHFQVTDAPWANYTISVFCTYNGHIMELDVTWSHMMSHIGFVPMLHQWAFHKKDPFLYILLSIPHCAKGVDDFVLLSIVLIWGSFLSFVTFPPPSFLFPFLLISLLSIPFSPLFSFTFRLGSVTFPNFCLVTELNVSCVYESTTSQ